MNEIYNNKKVLRGENFFISESSESSESNHIKILRSNQTFAMTQSIADAGRRYAKLSGFKSGEFAEKAFIYYMENHPLEDVPIIIQNQVKSEIVDRLEVVRMTLIEKRLKLYMKRLVDKDGNSEYLRRTMSKEIKQGLKIKHPPPEFVTLLEEASELV